MRTCSVTGARGEPEPERDEHGAGDRVERAADAAAVERPPRAGDDNGVAAEPDRRQRAEERDRARAARRRRAELRQQAREEREHLRVAEVAEQPWRNATAGRRAARPPCAVDPRLARAPAACGARARRDTPRPRAAARRTQARSPRATPRRRAPSRASRRPGPAPTPSAVATPVARLPSSVLRIVSAVSCPGVAITSAETPRKSSMATRSRVRRARAARARLRARRGAAAASPQA